MADEIDSGMTVGLEEEIMADLSAELSLTDPNFSQALLLPKVRSAIRAMRGARAYQNNPEYWTDERIEKDLYNYFDNIRGLAMDRYSKIGAEGQSSHSENGTSRAYQDEKRWFSSVVKISPPPSN